MSRARLARLLLAVTIVALAGWLLRGYVTDDTYIHLRYARNLVERGEFAFNPGHDTYGATSPLWIFGLALLLKIGLAPLIAAWVLGIISGLLAILLLDAILERLPFLPIWRAALLLMMVTDAWFLRWMFSGMETPLATMFLLLLLWPLVAARERGGRLNLAKIRERLYGRPLWTCYLAWGVTAGLAGLVRPEFLLLAPAALLPLLWLEYVQAGDADAAAGRSRARPYAPLLAAVAGWSLVVGPWLVYAWTTFGRLTPATAAAKSGQVSFAPAAVFGSLVRSAGQLAVVQGPIWVALLVLIGLVLLLRRYPDDHVVGGPSLAGSDRDELDAVVVDTGGWTVWLAVALLWIVAAWTTLLLGGYAVKGVWIISRYVAPLAPPLLLAAGTLAVSLADAVGPGRERQRWAKTALVTGWVATVALNAWLFFGQVVPHARRFPPGVQECYIGMGEWLRENTPPDAVVAALDIGAVGYASERRVLDLMGLVSPEILAVGRSLGFQEMVANGAWLETAGPDGRPAEYLVDRNLGLPRWQGRTVRGVTFELLKRCTIDGVGLREPQPWTVALYRLHRTEL